MSSQQTYLLGLVSGIVTGMVYYLGHEILPEYLSVSGDMVLETTVLLMIISYIGVTVNVRARGMPVDREFDILSFVSVFSLALVHWGLYQTELSFINDDQFLTVGVLVSIFALLGSLINSWVLGRGEELGI